jgi:hypothetical protein
MMKYEIRSKIKPSLILMRVSADDFETSKRKQLFYLSRSIHPVPEMQNHLIKFGILDFDFIITEPNEELRSSKRKKSVAQ